MSTEGFRICRNPKCSRLLDPERVIKHNATTCNASCRAAAWKAEQNYGRHSGRGSRANGSSRSGLQLSYHKAHRELVQRLWASEIPLLSMNEAIRVADEALRAALSERQRAKLEARTKGDQAQ